MGDTCSCLTVCFNFGLHVICLFQPVPDVGQQARTLADRALIAFGKTGLVVDEFRFHDPKLEVDEIDPGLQGR